MRKTRDSVKERERSEGEKPSRSQKQNKCKYRYKKFQKNAQQNQIITLR